MNKQEIKQQIKRSNETLENLSEMHKQLKTDKDKVLRRLKGNSLQITNEKKHLAHLKSLLENGN